MGGDVMPWDGRTSSSPRASSSSAEDLKVSQSLRRCLELRPRRTAEDKRTQTSSMRKGGGSRLQEEVGAHPQRKSQTVEYRYER